MAARRPRVAPQHARRVPPLRRALRSAVRVTAIAVTVLLVSGAGVAAVWLHTLDAEVASHAVALHQSPEQQRAQPLSGAFNVLLVGADNASGQHGFGASRQSTQNDVDILLHVAADHRSGVVLSMPRDTIVDHPACVADDGSQVPAEAAQPLNIDLMRGGLGCVVTTVQHLTGLTIPYAAEFSFQGTIAMADAVGGVPVCVSRAIDDPDSGLRLPAGRSVVTGRTALAYLRDRHGVGDGSDLARISSQQAYMSSLLRQATSEGTLTDPAKLFALAEQTAKNVSLSTSMAKPDVLVGMMAALLQVPLHDLSLVQLPTVPYPANPNKVMPDPALTAVLLKHLQHDTPVVLARGTHGYATDVTSTGSTTRSTASPSPSASASGSPSGGATTAPTKHDAPISGLSGQTASESTCSVAASG
ncbi:LCP family protein [Amnibacterium endophyticum]|uniref:LCP family protein n=1 Tax=Amnibacterium endophyticum TaxID=2109337 RepID=A0ABW4LH54_9MICO